MKSRILAATTAATLTVAATLTAITSPALAATTAPQPNSAALVTALHYHRPVTIAGIGSSVSVGATLPDRASQAPVGHLGQLLRAQFPASPITVDNLSVNGSTAWEGRKVYTEQVRPLHPTALLIAYGMNDGETAQYNSGETLHGSLWAMQAIIDMAKQDGVTVLVATTPSPHTIRNYYALPAGIPVTYPTAGGALVPSLADSVTTIGGQPFTTRHAIWNDKVRALTAAEGVTLVDAGRYWTQAEAYVGQDALFNPNEVVHPDLLGHALSYWRAEDDVTAALAAAAR